MSDKDMVKPVVPRGFMVLDACVEGLAEKQQGGLESN